MKNQLFSWPKTFFYCHKASWKNGKSFHTVVDQLHQLNYYCVKIPFKRKTPYLYIFIDREIDA